MKPWRASPSPGCLNVYVQSQFTSGFWRDSLSPTALCDRICDSCGSAEKQLWFVNMLAYILVVLCSEHERGFMGHNCCYQAISQQWLPGRTSSLHSTPLDPFCFLCCNVKCHHCCSLSTSEWNREEAICFYFQFKYIPLILIFYFWKRACLTKLTRLPGVLGDTGDLKHPEARTPRQVRGLAQA